jgi:hypothetical protein
MTMNESSPRKLWIAPTLEARAQASREGRIEEKLLAAELAFVDIHVSSAWDLVNWRGPQYPEAIPILLRHLPILYSDRTAEGIARSLARPFARPMAWEIVLDLYKKEPVYKKSGFKDGLAVAISSMARSSDLDTILELFNNKEHGSTRIFFVKNLSRSKNEAAFDALVHHIDDPQISPEIRHVLKGKLRRQKAKVLQ